MSGITRYPDETDIKQKVTEGGEEKVTVRDISAVELLKDILIELKVISTHLSLMTDVDITEGEIT